MNLEPSNDFERGLELLCEICGVPQALVLYRVDHSLISVTIAKGPVETAGVLVLDEAIRNVIKDPALSDKVKQAMEEAE